MGGTTIIRRAPIGWSRDRAVELPQSLAAFKYAPALAAGCTLVIKPSPETVLDSMLVAEAAAESGIPGGVINFVRRAGGRRVPGLAPGGGQDLLHRLHSRPAARSRRYVGGCCARSPWKLGGKSAAIVLDDADLDLPPRGEAVQATLLNNGQTCFLGTRVLAPRSTLLRGGGHLRRAGRLAQDRGLRWTRRPRSARWPATGSGTGRGLHRQGQGRGRPGGGRRRPPVGSGQGWFVEPTIFADVDNNHTIAQEEIFGPVCR